MQCRATVTGPNSLPAVGLRACDDAAFAWAFEARDGGAHVVTIMWATPGAGFNQTGSHFVPPADIARDDGGSVVTERYVGPAWFGISPLLTFPTTH